MIFCFLAFMVNTEINLENLGFYAPQIRIYKVDSNYLICGSTDNLVCLMTSSGQPIGKYDKSGPGPMELSNPFVFGVTNHNILVISRQRHLIAFDHHLNPVGKEIPPVKLTGTQVFGGVYRGEGRFLAFTACVQAPLFQELELRGRDWVTVSSLIDCEINLEDRGFSKSASYQNGLCFVTNGSFYSNEEYVIEVHDVAAELRENVVMILSAPIKDELVGRERALLLSRVKIGEYFKVKVAAGSSGRWRYWLDTFNAQGKHLSRQDASEDDRIIPVINDKEVFVLSEDTMTLRPMAHL